VSDPSHSRCERQKRDKRRFSEEGKPSIYNWKTFLKEREKASLTRSEREAEEFWEQGGRKGPKQEK